MVLTTCNAIHPICVQERGWGPWYIQVWSVHIWMLLYFASEQVKCNFLNMTCLRAEKKNIKKEGEEKMGEACTNVGQHRLELLTDMHLSVS
jgi:hypothetical protein